MRSRGRSGALRLGPLERERPEARRPPVRWRRKAFRPTTRRAERGSRASTCRSLSRPCRGRGRGRRGARVFAALVGGQLDPSGRPADLRRRRGAAMEPVERARRIAFAGGGTILLSGSLRQNFLYGCPDPDRPTSTSASPRPATAAGLDRLVHARGLSGTIDPAREPQLAAALVEARRAVRATLAVEDLAGLRRSLRPGALQPPRDDRREHPVRQAHRRYVPRGRPAAHPFVRASARGGGA